MFIKLEIYILCMSKRKNKQKDIDEDMYDEGDEDYEDDESSDESLYDEDESLSESFNKQTLQGERAVEKPTSEMFYNVTPYIYDLKMMLLGYSKKNGEYVQTSHAKMRTEFIETMLEQINSVLATHNFNSYIKEEEINNILIQQNYAFIRILMNEPSIKSPSDVEAIAVMFDVTLELFIKSLKDGKGAEGVRQSIGGVYENLSNSASAERVKGIRFGYGKHELEIGGDKY